MIYSPIKKYGLALLAFFFLPFMAEASCGNITYIEYIDFNEYAEVSEPIEDCYNPFNTDASVGYSPILTLNDSEVDEGETVTLEENAQVSIEYAISPTGYGSFFMTDLYRKTESGYRQVSASFGGDYFLEGLPEGDYVAVYISETIFLIDNHPRTWTDKLKEFFLPKLAHAFYEDYQEVTTVSFTIEYRAAEPAGASSVLFLPGIQASRLYTDGVLGTENQLWIPNRDNDVEKLAFNESGESINDVYTRDVVSEIGTTKNVYKSFLDLISELKNEGSIKDYKPFAYDWRYDVFTVATKPVQYPDGQEKLLLEEVKRLASESHTGKVTIVAHSNGGLVAKALMNEYQDTELAGLIEKVILVATPQIGTPKAVGSLLHGLDQSLLKGLLANRVTARRATQYMPGAYGLLPSKTYFDDLTEPMITSDSSEVALPVSSYGDFSNYDNFIKFLTDAESTRNEVNNITQPVSLDETILNQIINNQVILDDWVAPSDVQVYEVVGTGLRTIKGFYYKEFSCRENPHCILKPFLNPMPLVTSEGDETVVLKSATAYDEDKITYTIDLEQESRGVLNKDIIHANFTESDSVSVFLESALLYPQITDTLETAEFGSISESYTIIGVHSPVSILVQNQAGETVGIVDGEIKEEIPGSSYFEFAGSKYVIVPSTEQIEVLLEGEESGRYSLTIEELSSDNEQVLVQEVLGATSTPGMVVGFNCADSFCSSAEIDYDADGQIEATFDWEGSYADVNPTLGQETVVTESRSKPITGTRVRQPSGPAGQVAGVYTSVTDENLLRMWAQVMEIKEEIEELKYYYSVKIKI